MTKRWRGFLWTPVISHSVWTVFVFPLPPMQLTTDFLFACRAKGWGKSLLGRMALDPRVTMTKTLLIQLRSCSCGFVFFSVCCFQHCVGLRSCEWEWFCRLVFDARMWKPNNGRGRKARIYPVPRDFIPRSGGIWTVGAPQVVFRFFFNLFALTLRPVSAVNGALQKPCARNFDPAGDEAGAVSGTQMESQHGISPQLPLKLSRKRNKNCFKCVSPCVDVLYCCPVACRVSCNTPVVVQLASGF